MDAKSAQERRTARKIKLRTHLNAHPESYLSSLANRQQTEDPRAEESRSHQWAA